MNSSKDPRTRQCRNVLALDGGGVRGLSSLLILEELMRYTNIGLKEAVREVGGDAETLKNLEPQDVFDFVAGTSTGGLIAIMLGKLGMNLQQCIEAYKRLSKEIFGKKHTVGRITHGLAKTRYSGSRLESCIRRLIEENNFEAAIEMASDSNGRDMACAVICREHSQQSIYSELKDGAVPICSLECPTPIRCCVSEAARATSAAPTYFPFQKIGNRYFVDGGIEFNNPSRFIFEHYTEFDLVSAARGRAGNVEEVNRGARHGHLDLSRVRFVNIGTGDKPKDKPRKRDVLAVRLVPGFIRMGIFLKKTLTEIAVKSGEIAGHMVTLARVSNEDSRFDMRYERFSADNGVCYKKLDKHKELEEIEALTIEYINHATTQDRLKALGEDIARDYLQTHPHGAATQPAPTTTTSTKVDVPEINTSRSPNTTSQRPGSLQPSIRAEASTSGSSEYDDGATPGTKDPSTQDTEASISFTTPAQRLASNGHSPADAPLKEPQAMAAPESVPP